MSLFEVTDLDRNIYDEELRDFLPEQIIDIHTHVYLRKFKKEKNPAVKTRVVAWPEMVARDNSIEDLMESYGLMFPGKDVKALIFSNLSHGDDGAAANRYVSESSQKSGYPAWTLHSGVAARPDCRVEFPPQHGAVHGRRVNFLHASDHSCPAAAHSRFADRSGCPRGYETQKKPGPRLTLDDGFI